MEIVLEPSEVSWETPVRFTYRASDKEQDPVRALNWDFGDGQSSNKESPEHRYAEWDGSLKHKTYTVVLNATDGHSEVTARKTIKVTSGPTPKEMLQKLLQEISNKERIIKRKSFHRKHVNYSYNDTKISKLNRITKFGVDNLPLLQKYDAVYSENKISIPLKFGPNKKAQLEAVSYDKLYLLKKELKWSLVMTFREINKSLQFGYVNSKYVSLKYE